MLCESALSRTDEKHHSIDHIICLVQFVDGSKKADGYGLITRVTRRNGWDARQGGAYRIFRGQ